MSKKPQCPKGFNAPCDYAELKKHLAAAHEGWDQDDEKHQKQLEISERKLSELGEGYAKLEASWQELQAQLKNKVGMQGYETKCFRNIASTVCTCDSCMRDSGAPDSNLEKMWHKGPEGKGGTG